MKLIIAIVRDTDYDSISHALTAESFRVTSVASTGGFLRRGQTTMLIGVEDTQLEQALEVIRTSCLSCSSEPEGKRATVFVVKVDQFERF